MPPWKHANKRFGNRRHITLATLAFIFREQSSPLIKDSDGRVSNSLVVALDDADSLDGRTSEVPHPEAGVLRRREHQALGGMGAAVRQLPLVTCSRTKGFEEGELVLHGIKM